MVLRAYGVGYDEPGGLLARRSIVGELLSWLLDGGRCEVRAGHVARRRHVYGGAWQRNCGLSVHQRAGGRFGNRLSPNDRDADAVCRSRQPAVPQWSFTSERDKMRDKSVYFAGLTSPDGEMVISVRRGDPGSPFGLDIILMLTRGQLQCASEQCFYAVKFDNAPVERWPFLDAEGLNTHVVLAQGAARFLEKLRKAHAVTIEIKRFQGGLEQIAFNLPPLDAWQGLAVDAAVNAAANAAAAPPKEPRVNLDEFIETPAKR